MLLMGEIPETSLKRKREIDFKSAFADNDTSICNMFVFNLRLLEWLSQLTAGRLGSKIANFSSVSVPACFISLRYGS